MIVKNVGRDRIEQSVPIGDSLDTLDQHNLDQHNEVNTVGLIGGPAFPKMLAYDRISAEQASIESAAMGTWCQVISSTERERYKDLLANSNPIYAGTTMQGINRLLDKRRGRAYVFTETSPDGTRLLFQILLLVTPDRVDADVLKIVNAGPIGDYDPRLAAKILGRKVRCIRSNCDQSRTQEPRAVLACARVSARSCA